MHPAVVKHVLTPLHERLLGRPTLRWLRAWEATQWWPPHRLRELQTRKLRTLLRHAHERCPFYRGRIGDAGASPERFDFGDLPCLPPITKCDIAENLPAMLDASVPGGLRSCTTGGSSGAPLRFMVDRGRQAADQAARHRSRRWFGIDVGRRELYVWGSPVERSAQDRLKSLRDHLTNQRMLDAFRMTPARMTRYLDVIRRFDPVHVFGYPSSLARLVRHAEETGRPVRTRSLRAVFVTGEVFHPHDRARIESTVGVPVADGYGAREAGFIAHQCPHGSYHVTMESMIVELLDASGRPAADGEPGEVTITHLDAFGMPFIRYRTGDVARRSTRPCPCGRGLECLERIEGRRTDMLRTADGGYAHALSVIYVLRDDPEVQEFKVVQRANLDLDVAIVPRRWSTAALGCDVRVTPQPGRSQPRAAVFQVSQLGATRIDRLRGLLERRIGPGPQVRISLTDEIEPDPSGKHRCVVSEAG